MAKHKPQTQRLVKPIVARFIRSSKYSDKPRVQAQLDMYLGYLRDTLRHSPGYI